MLNSLSRMVMIGLLVSGFKSLIEIVLLLMLSKYYIDSKVGRILLFVKLSKFNLFAGDFLRVGSFR